MSAYFAKVFIGDYKMPLSSQYTASAAISLRGSNQLTTAFTMAFSTTFVFSSARQGTVINRIGLVIVKRNKWQTFTRSSETFFLDLD